MLHIVGWQRNNNNVNTENQNTIRIQTVQWLIIFSVTMVERRQSDQKNRQKCEFTPYRSVCLLPLVDAVLTKGIVRPLSGKSEV